MNKLILALAAIALLGVVAAQDELIPALRNKTISSGLTGPYHWYLDASYLVLAIAIMLSVRGWMAVWGTIAALALIATAFTNTCGDLIDRIYGGGFHSILHTRATIIVFVTALLMELSSGRLVWLTVATVVAAAVCYAWFEYRPTVISGVMVAASPAAEKLAVSLLCVWFIVWALCQML